MNRQAWIVGRRRRTMARRKARGLERPLPLRVITVNCMSISAGRVRAEAILRNAAPLADVLLGSECSDFNAREVLGSEWDVRHDTTSQARAGSMIAVRRERGRIISGAELRLGSKRGHGILDRWFWDAQIVLDEKTPHRWLARFVAGHAPPMRAWALWPGFMRSVQRTQADVVGADFNKLARAVQPALGRRVRAVHILATAVRWWVPTSIAYRVDVEGDHAAVGVVLWPSRDTEAHKVNPFRPRNKESKR